MSAGVIGVIIGLVLGGAAGYALALQRRPRKRTRDYQDKGTGGGRW